MAHQYFTNAGVNAPNELNAKEELFSARANTAGVLVYCCLNQWMEAYEAHVNNVEDLFSMEPERLLRMNIVAGDSWEKLCGFLGKRVPRAPFPRE
jgi:hypothetical protein